jgi:hypothetical protein
VSTRDHRLRTRHGLGDTDARLAHRFFDCRRVAHPMRPVRHVAGPLSAADRRPLGVDGHFAPATFVLRSRCRPDPPEALSAMTCSCKGLRDNNQVLPRTGLGDLLSAQARLRLRKCPGRGEGCTPSISGHRVVIHQPVGGTVSANQRLTPLATSCVAYGYGPARLPAGPVLTSLEFSMVRLFSVTFSPQQSSCVPQPLQRSQQEPSRPQASHDDHHLPLDRVVRPMLTTAEAAYYLNLKPQTLRVWACKENGPLRPVRLHGRLGWPVTAVRRYLGLEQTQK